MVKAKKQTRSEQEDNVATQLIKFTDLSKDQFTITIAQSVIAQERVYAVQAFEKATLDTLLENPNMVFKYERLSSVVVIVRWRQNEDYLIDVEKHKKESTK